MKNHTTSKQLENWRGRFGDAYVDRNDSTKELVGVYTRAFSTIFNGITDGPLNSILECGCNVGIALQALAIITDADLYAIEPNDKARTAAINSKVTKKDQIIEGSVQNIPFGDACFDLTFTSGVLIHVSPDELDQAFDELARVSKNYILMIEYYSRDLIEVPYRGQDGMLWKGDYGKLFLERNSNWSPVDAGFFWHTISGFDDTNWWLLKKNS